MVSCDDKRSSSKSITLFERLYISTKSTPPSLGSGSISLITISFAATGLGMAKRAVLLVDITFPMQSTTDPLMVKVYTTPGTNAVPRLRVMLL